MTTANDNKPVTKTDSKTGITTVTKRYEGTTGTIHQSGTELSRSKGINVVLHYRPDAKTPHAAEVYSDNQREYAELGLEFDGNSITGYDGAFDIPKQVLALLRECGHDTTELE